ncbi:ParB N-terminal domain-containing protein [Mammaliicoccus sciuri]|uniref:ParB N-terminal domain-containing protein n=1 Tax=Mammaliicoccus sciuri TaxID=1296 RepID=UPI00233FFED2|nr:ParB N-terminal domain-containing protein [Mammaliicoccus sciuri]MDC5693315.1 ParB N-terminal domain-containing protein [Mammaliicoccus sciuri]
MEEQTLRIEKLKFDDEINELVPEMNEDEWNNFLTSVEKEGIRQPIDVNKDMTIIDGRHRVKASKELGITELQARVHDLTRIEMLKFVRDTAVERRNLTKAQILNIVLSTDDLVGDLEARAKENQKRSIEVAHKHNPNHKKDRLASEEPNLLKPQNTNEELGKIAGVSKATVQRAKKIKKENPKAYEKVVKGESTWRTEYDKLLKANKKEEPQVDKPIEQPKPQSNDIRVQMNEYADSVTDEERKVINCEMSAINIVEKCKNLLYTIDGIEDLELTLRFLSTQEVESLEKVIKVSKALDKIIEKGELKNV